MRISVHVYVTDKRVAARVVYIDSQNPLHRGIELDEPRNIWGVPLPPNDWDEKAAFEMGRPFDKLRFTALLVALFAAASQGSVGRSGTRPRTRLPLNRSC